MSKSIKHCELDPNKICNDCNECNICDLDPTKLCDSCGKCLELEGMDYREITIDGIADEDDVEDYISEIDDVFVDEKLQKIFDDNCDEDIQIEYIEDIPELKKEYDKKIDDILKGNKDHED